MAKRLEITKWLWCLLVLQVGPAWHAVRCATAQQQAGGPATVEAQAKFFQDFFSVQLSPYKLEYGHVCEDPNTWEQRYESNDFQNHRSMGKVRWGDKKGGYGEHYWDLNHAGGGGGTSNPETTTGKNKLTDEDDGSYDPAKYEKDAFDEPNDLLPLQESNESAGYEDSKATNYAGSSLYRPIDENNRRKRHPNHKGKKYKWVPAEEDEEEEKDKESHNHKHNYEKEESEEEEEEPEEKPKKKVKKVKKIKAKHEEPAEESTTNAQVVEDSNDAQQFYLPNPPVVPSPYVPYMHGGGALQPYQTLAPGPRLYLEPSTGHVVDRETGQAYILKPILNQFN